MTKAEDGTSVSIFGIDHLPEISRSNSTLPESVILYSHWVHGRVYKEVVERYVLLKKESKDHLNAVALCINTSVFFYEPFHELKHFADVLFSSEGQRHGCQAQCIRISESGVRSTTSRQGKYIRALGIE